MRRSHFAAWPPHCPICARAGATAPVLLPPTDDGAAADVVSAILVCAEPTCRAEYPVIDGIPVIMAELRRHLGEHAVALLLRDDLDPAALSLLGDAIGPDTWFDNLRQTVSTYMWDAYADLDPAEPATQPGEPGPGAAGRCLQALLALGGPPDGRRVLDLGCAAGRTSFTLAAAHPDALVLGIDANLGLLRHARRAATEGRVHYARRRLGTVYDDRAFAVALPGADRTDFWACDAAALPFASGTADLVVALNLLDCVPDPVALLHEMARALPPDGTLLLATPFDWAARATPPANWIGGHSQRGPGGGAAEPLLHSLLGPADHPRAVAGLRRLGVADGAWHTRLHDRAFVLYRSHLVALRAAPGLDTPGRSGNGPLETS